jgi:hypothetical protein
VVEKFGRNNNKASVRDMDDTGLPQYESPFISLGNFRLINALVAGSMQIIFSG